MMIALRAAQLEKITLSRLFFFMHRHTRGSWPSPYPRVSVYWYNPTHWCETDLPDTTICLIFGVYKYKLSWRHVSWSVQSSLFAESPLTVLSRCESRARNTSVPSVCQGPYAGWNRTQPMTYNQFTSRDVTSLSVNPERSWNETKTVFYSSFSAKSYDHYSGMKEKKLTIHSRVSADLKFAHFCDDVFGESRSTCQHKFRTFYHANHVARPQVLSPRLFLEYFVYDRFGWFR